VARKVADPVTAYAKAVAARKIVAGPWVRLACARHVRDLKTRKKTGMTWEPTRALKAIEFFAEVLVLESGRSFRLEAFQQFIVGSLFGWYAKDGNRRFRTAYVEIGKGNGKSPLAAGLGLYGLVADGEGSAEVYSAATTQDQARIVWRDADRMVEQSPDLNAEFGGVVKREAACLSYGRPESVFRPVSSEHKGLDGKRVHFGLIDELHEHPSAMVVDKIRAGTKARRNALIFEITNSGWDRHSVCWNHHEYSLKVLQGIIDNPSWFAYVGALDEKDDWRNPKRWLKANPGLGTILPLKYLQEQVAEAIGMPSKENLCRRLNFCEWTEQSIRAIPMDEWDRGSAEIDLEALRGRACYGGLDLAKVNDLSAFTLLFPPSEDGETWKALVWYWLPEDDMLPRVKRDRVPYDVWVREGFIKTTPGNVTDYGFIQAQVLKQATIYQIQEIAFDRTFGGEIVQNLMAEGLTMVEFGQGFISMAAPVAELLRLVKKGQLQHGGNPVLRWNASNLATVEDAAGNLKPDKEHSYERIDGIVAICNALGRAIARPADGESIYDQRLAAGEQVIDSW
jgi:phage terminase large subunit-like protein